MDGGSWTNIYGTTIWSGVEKYWQNIVSRPAIFRSDSVRCVCFLFFYDMVWPVLLCSRTRYADSISLAFIPWLIAIVRFTLSHSLWPHNNTLLRSINLYLSRMKNQRWVGNGPPRRQRTLEQRYSTLKSDIEKQRHSSQSYDVHNRPNASRCDHGKSVVGTK